MKDTAAKLFAGFGIGAFAASCVWWNTSAAHRRENNDNFDQVSWVAQECMADLERHFVDFHPDEWAEANQRRTMRRIATEAPESAPTR